MTFVLLASLGSGLVCSGVGFLLGLAARRAGCLARWALPSALVLGVFLVPAVFVLDWAVYVLNSTPPGQPEAHALALRFAVWSVLALGAALGGSLVTAVRRPLLAPLGPLLLFAVQYALVLPLVARVRNLWEIIEIDNVPVVWFFVSCTLATAALTGHALGRRGHRGR